MKKPLLIGFMIGAGITAIELLFFRSLTVGVILTYEVLFKLIFIIFRFSNPVRFLILIVIINLFVSIIVSLFVWINFKYFVKKNKKLKAKMLIINVLCLVFFVVNFSPLFYALCLESDKCVKGVITVSKSDFICKNMSDVDGNDCYTNVALITGDQSYCNQLKFSLNSECYYLVAVKLNNFSLCGSSDSKINCYQKVLSNLGNDEQVCNKMQNLDEKNLCLAMVSDDQSFCEKIEPNKSEYVTCNNFIEMSAHGI